MSVSSDTNIPEFPMRIFLMTIFSLILLSMVTISVLATMQNGIFEAGSELMKDRWFVATLMDAYFGFITFYVWVAYKETTVVGRGIWFVLIMLLGTIAMSIYMLIQLSKLPSDAGFRQLLVRTN